MPHLCSCFWYLCCNNKSIHWYCGSKLIIRTFSEFFFLFCLPLLLLSYHAEAGLLQISEVFLAETSCLELIQEQEILCSINCQKFLLRQYNIVLILTKVSILVNDTENQNCTALYRTFPKITISLTLSWKFTDTWIYSFFCMYLNNHCTIPFKGENAQLE